MIFVAPSKIDCLSVGQQAQPTRSGADAGAICPSAAPTKLQRQRAARARWKARNPAAVKASRQAYAQRHKDEINAKQRARRIDNPAPFLAKEKKWRELHPHREAAKYFRRRAAVTRPLTEFDDLVLAEAFDLRKRRGPHWEVDHIVPICGRAVTGLHNGFNVQVVPKQWNRSKGNRHTQTYFPCVALYAAL